jgi:hypothetical protein
MLALSSSLFLFDAGNGTLGCVEGQPFKFYNRTCVHTSIAEIQLTTKSLTDSLICHIIGNHFGSICFYLYMELLTKPTSYHICPVRTAYYNIV